MKKRPLAAAGILVITGLAAISPTAAWADDGALDKPDAPAVSEHSAPPADGVQIPPSESDPTAQETTAPSAEPSASDPVPVDSSASTTTTTSASQDATLAKAAPPRLPLSATLQMTALVRKPGEGVPDSIRARFGTGTENKFAISRPTPGGQSAGTVPAGFEEFYSQSVDWESCLGYGYPDDARFSCGYAIVPLDYAKPEGQTIAIGMLKAHAGDNAKKGTLFVDPGGPGGSGMGTVAGRADQFAAIGLLEDFDVIGFDPRGVGSSAPAISCLSNIGIDAIREGFSVAVMRNWMVKSGCAANTGLEYPGLDAGAFLKGVGTNQVVRDLDVMRSTVGDARLNYLGYSYGTSIGYHYALQFPENIRAMVLDAIVHPFENNPEEKAKYEEFFKNGGKSQSESMQEARDQFVKRCTEQGGFDYEGTKVPCAADVLKNPPTAPVWSDSAQRYLGAVSDPDAGSDFTFAISKAMYSDAQWAKLNAGLYAIQQNSDPAALLSLADAYFGRKPNGTYGNGEGAFLQIKICADDGNTACSNPAADLLRKGEPISALTNVLAISGTYDNATAYPNGVVMAKGIRGTLLSVATNQHGSVASRPAVTCADVIASTYLRTLQIVRDPGKTGVETKDIYSNKIVGDQCQIDEQWRAVPTTGDQSIDAGQTLQITASGLTRGGKYDVTVSAPDGSTAFQSSTPVVAGSDGTITVPILVKRSADSGDYRLRVTGAEEITKANADAISTLKVTGIVLPTPDDAGISLAAAMTTPDGQQTIYGTGFDSGADITLHLDGAENPLLTTVKADDAGSFLVSLPLSGLSLGEHTIVAVGEDGVSREATFIVQAPAPQPTGTAAVTVSAVETRTGGQLTARGTGFIPGELVTAVMHSKPLEIGQKAADANGAVTFTWTVPQNTEPGTHRIVLTGSITPSVAATFSVTANGSLHGALAQTGGTASAGTLTIGAVLLLIGGGVAYATNRRKREHDTV